MSISESLRARVRTQAKDRCGYCLIEDGLVYAPMEIDHLRPKSDGGEDVEENLWLACPCCNTFKGARTQGTDPLTGLISPLFNPRQQIWAEHFAFADDKATIIGHTPCGRATINTLRLNFAPNLELRKRFVELGWYPPED
jgi:hypothetical protein